MRCQWQRPKYGEKREESQIGKETLNGIDYVKVAESNVNSKFWIEMKWREMSEWASDRARENERNS